MLFVFSSFCEFDLLIFDVFCFFFRRSFFDLFAFLSCGLVDFFDSCLTSFTFQLDFFDSKFSSWRSSRKSRDLDTLGCKEVMVVMKVGIVV